MKEGWAEDKCEVCGKHLGWGVTAFHLKRCEAHRESKPPAPSQVRYVDVMWPKKHLVQGAYYAGMCRNARVARWDGERFWYWREKFGSRFLEPIRHPEDDDGFDLFYPVIKLLDAEAVEIPLGKEEEKP